MTQTRWTVPLGEAVDPRVAGQKAATLARLLLAGFPVPDGFVVLADAPDEALDDAVTDGLHRLDGAPVAVRSSGTAEDLGDASYAGMYDTILDVSGVDAVRQAVRRCRASVTSPRVATYRQARQAGRPARMAVVVQRMVRADVAGVAFTADPVTGERGVAIVNAVRGLGDRLVDGTAPADEWVVRGGSVIRRGSTVEAIDEAQVMAVTALARRVEAVLGSPQDVEWAMAGERLFLLQARPITALPEEPIQPVPLPADPPPGFWWRDASHSPVPQSPALRACITRHAAAAVQHACSELGLLFETLEYREIGGWLYLRIVPLGGKSLPAPPRWLMPILLRATPKLRRRVRSCVRAIRDDQPGRLIELWSKEWRDRFAAQIASLRDKDLSGLSDADLDGHLAASNDLLRSGLDVHFRLHGAIGTILGELAFTGREVLGWRTDEIVFALLEGSSTTSTEPAGALATVADEARRSPLVRQLLDEGAPPESVLAADPAFAAAFADYARTYGCRALRYEVADPTLAEEPALLLGLIRDQVTVDFDPASLDAVAARAAQATVEVRQALTRLDRASRARFERALARARRAYPVREDNEFFTVSAPLALIRYALLEVGRRLTQRGLLGAVDDVFFLELSEASATLRDGRIMGELVRRRKGERAWALAHAGPASYGAEPGPPPALDALPPEARLANEAFLWLMNHIVPPPNNTKGHPPNPKVVTGIPASAGTYRGTVRVILRESEFHKLRPGDVLVCPATSPVWSVLFPSVGALVADTGGSLSHQAIIAREFGIPAVVTTENATTLLHDGQIVTVDGSAGTIHIEQ